MKSTLVLTIGVCVATVVCGAQWDDISKRLSLSAPVNNGLYGIWGSDDASIEDYPYNAAIVQTAFESVIGGGMIYKDQWIITSGSTGTRNPPHEIYVRVGSRNATGGGQRLNVIKVVDHPTFGYCVCLLKLNKKIKFGKTAKRIQIGKKQPAPGCYVSVTGFGKPYSPMLRHQITIAIGRDKCLAKYSPYVGNLTKLDFCALSGPDNQDSGDTMVHRGKAVAVFIRDQDGPSEFSPGVYCDITKLRSWIDKTIKYNEKTIK